MRRRLLTFVAAVSITVGLLAPTTTSAPQASADGTRTASTAAQQTIPTSPGNAIQPHHPCPTCDWG
jgi:hypothetical protein